MKTFNAPVKFKADGPEGTFEATFAWLNQVDKDGDVTLPGAFKNGQRVKIAAWSHNWGALTVGKGTIYADDSRAWIEGQFNLATQAGREHYETVKFNGEEQEWSYGFNIEKRSTGDYAGQHVQFLEALDVHEVSPVLIGAGNNTRLDWIKGANLTGQGMTFESHSEHVRVAVRELVTRAQAGSALRLKEGRTISEDRHALLAAMSGSLTEAARELDALLGEIAPPTKANASDVMRLRHDHDRTRARLAREFGVSA